MAELMEREEMTENQKVFFEKYLRATFRFKKIITRHITFRMHEVPQSTLLRLFWNWERIYSLAKEVFPDFELEERRIALYADKEVKTMLVDYINRSGKIPSNGDMRTASRDILPTASAIVRVFGHTRMVEIYQSLREEGLITRDVKVYKLSDFKPTINPRIAP